MRVPVTNDLAAWLLVLRADGTDIHQGQPQVVSLVVAIDDAAAALDAHGALAVFP